MSSVFKETFEKSRLSRNNITLENNQHEDAFDIDGLIDKVGGVNFVRNLIAELKVNYPGIDDITEMADITYSRVEGNNISFEEWVSVLEYVEL